MRKKERSRGSEGFSLSFLDVICCGFGAIILLLVLVKVGEPGAIELAREDLDGLIALLQEELYEIRGETNVLNRDLVSKKEQLSEEQERIARLLQEAVLLKKATWAEAGTAGAFEEPDWQVDAVRLSPNPRAFATPRPYLEGSKGEWRKIFILGPDGVMAVKPWEQWTQKPERTWHALTPTDTRAMITVFGTPRRPPGPLDIAEEADRR